jgi:hypothetical protein
MSKYAVLFAAMIAAGVFSAAAWPAAAPDRAPANARIPDFSSSVAWVAEGNDLMPPASGPGPVGDDPQYPHVGNFDGGQPTFRIANLDNPILKPRTVEQMRKANQDVLAGKIAYTARSSCMPSGVPGFLVFPVEPIYFVQTAKQVLIVFSGDQQVRRVYLDVAHRPGLKPSWYGESVGHYEGDTLVVDTVGQNALTFIDSYRTPHSEKIHVIERFRLIDGGDTLEVGVYVEDEEAFHMPWTATQRYRRVKDPILEQVCAENNQNIFDFNIPEDDTPDF